MLVYAGDAEEGSGVAPFRALATPIADMVRPMPYPEIFPPEDRLPPGAVAQTMFVDRVDRTMAETIVEHLEASDAPMRAAQLRVLGGAMARVPTDATAFAHRVEPDHGQRRRVLRGPTTGRDARAWVENFAAALHQGDDGAYVNFLATRARRASATPIPGATWDRLAAIKRATTRRTCSG